jgi:hypothetical protein
MTIQYAQKPGWWHNRAGETPGSIPSPEGKLPRTPSILPSDRGATQRAGVLCGCEASQEAAKSHFLDSRCFGRLCRQILRIRLRKLRQVALRNITMTGTAKRPPSWLADVTLSCVWVANLRVEPAETITEYEIARALRRLCA